MTLVLTPSMDCLTDPFDDFAQILAVPFGIAEVLGTMFAVMASITDELFADHA